MKHNYTFQELDETAYEARKAPGALGTLTRRDVEAILDALPDPTPSTEWQANHAEVIEVGDVREGDRILIKTTHGSFYEVTITSISSLREPVGITLRWADGSIYESSIDSIYLFNRPIVHPDPDEHKVIRCDRTDRILMATPDGDYISEHGLTWTPSNFHEWTPMKVVADNDR